MIGFGPRSALGFFLTPLSQAHGWGREVFALSVAVQTLLYGAAQPFSGAIADRFGTVRVIIAGTLLYAAGLFMVSASAKAATAPVANSAAAPASPGRGGRLSSRSTASA